MKELVPFITAIGVSLLVSTIILMMITRPLRQVLGLLCRNGESTAFWVSFTTVMLYGTPLLFAVMWTPIFSTEPILAVRTALISALFGAIGGLLVVGYKISSARQI